MAIKKVTYGYTGAPQTFTVPEGVTSINVTLVGAGNQYSAGGKTTGTVDVSDVTEILVYVGGTLDNIWNGGGTGSGNNGADGTDIRIGGSTYNDRVLVAGGAGAFVRESSSGGVGGGLTGGSGVEEYQGLKGSGGTQSEGGTGGVSPDFDGSFGKGGGGYAGGGGGWYGGGGGWYATSFINYFGGGGGGSGYINHPRVTNGETITGAGNAGDGQVIIEYEIVTVVESGANIGASSAFLNDNIKIVNVSMNIGSSSDVLNEPTKIIKNQIDMIGDSYFSFDSIHIVKSSYDFQSSSIFNVKPHTVLNGDFEMTANSEMILIKPISTHMESISLTDIESIKIIHEEINMQQNSNLNIDPINIKQSTLNWKSDTSFSYDALKMLNGIFEMKSLQSILDITPTLIRTSSMTFQTTSFLVIEYPIIDHYTLVGNTKIISLKGNTEQVSLDGIVVPILNLQGNKENISLVSKINRIDLKGEV